MTTNTNKLATQVQQLTNKQINKQNNHSYSFITIIMKFLLQIFFLHAVVCKMITKYDHLKEYKMMKYYVLL